MDQLSFLEYLLSAEVDKKVVSDHISRLKRLEKSIANCDLDEEYYKDKCKYLMSLLCNKGENIELKKVLIGSLPIGKYTMNTFRYSIRKYVKFMDSRQKL